MNGYNTDLSHKVSVCVRVMETKVGEMEEVAPSLLLCFLGMVTVVLPQPNLCHNCSLALSFRSRA